MHYVNVMCRSSIGFKMLLAYVTGVVLSILLIASAAFALIISDSDMLLIADVAERSHELANKIEFDATGVPIGFDSSQDNRIWSYKSLGQEIGYRVLDSAANVTLTSTKDEFWPSSTAFQPLESKQFNFERKGLLMYAATSAVEHDGKTWYLQFAASKRLMELLHVGFAWPFMGAGIALFSLVLLFVFGVCAYITLGYTLKPLRDMSESAAAISPQSLHSRLQVETVPSEVAPLVDSFNDALERLEQGYRVQQDFLATAAHELKTPLALIRAQIELMEQSEDRKALLSDVAHMTRQVQQLLLLAEASEAHNYCFTAVNILDVIKDTTLYLRRMADAAGVRFVLTSNTVALCSWQADRSAVFTLLKNLLENAIQHAPPGTEVHIELDANELIVRDWGSGVGTEQLLKIFIRFWRGAHRRDHGAGLGLTICKEIAHAHGWTLYARNAEPGLLFCLSRSESCPG